MPRTTRALLFLQLAVLYPVHILSRSVPGYAPHPPIVEEKKGSTGDRPQGERPAHPRDTPPDRDRVSA